MEADEIVRLGLAPVTLIITFGGIILLVRVLRDYIKAAVSSLLVDRIMKSEPEQQKVFIRYLCDKDWTLEELSRQHRSRR